MAIKKCKQCGVMKPPEQFRTYYGGRKGRYKTCLTCEKINSRYKYLTAKVDFSEAEQAESEKIDQLYQLQRERGLKPPGTLGHTVDLQAELDRYKEPDVPEELAKWLDEDLSKHTVEFLQETVADQLLKSYRPVLSMDGNYKPVYDETYREVINKILKRFDDYEDDTP